MTRIVLYITVILKYRTSGEFLRSRTKGSIIIHKILLINELNKLVSVFYTLT